MEIEKKRDRRGRKNGGKERKKGGGKRDLRKGRKSSVEETDNVVAVPDADEWNGAVVASRLPW